MMRPNTICLRWPRARCLGLDVIIFATCISVLGAITDARTTAQAPSLLDLLPNTRPEKSLELDCSELVQHLNLRNRNRNLPAVKAFRNILRSLRSNDPDADKNIRKSFTVVQPLWTLNSPQMSHADFVRLTGCICNTKEHRTIFMEMVHQGLVDAVMHPFASKLHGKQLTKRLDTNGDSILHLAAQTHNVQMVNYIMNLSGDDTLRLLELKNKLGQTPRDIAIESGTRSDILDSMQARHQIEKSSQEDEAETAGAGMPQLTHGAGLSRSGQHGIRPGVTSMTGQTSALPNLLPPGGMMDGGGHSVLSAMTSRGPASQVGTHGHGHGHAGAAPQAGMTSLGPASQRLASRGPASQALAGMTSRSPSSQALAGMTSRGPSSQALAGMTSRGPSSQALAGMTSRGPASQGLAGMTSRGPASQGLASRAPASQALAGMTSGGPASQALAGITSRGPTSTMPPPPTSQPASMLPVPPVSNGPPIMSQQASIASLGFQPQFGGAASVVGSQPPTSMAAADVPTSAQPAFHSVGHGQPVQPGSMTPTSMLRSTRSQMTAAAPQSQIASQLSSRSPSSVSSRLKHAGAGDALGINSIKGVAGNDKLTTDKVNEMIKEMSNFKDFADASGPETMKMRSKLADLANKLANGGSVEADTSQIMSQPAWAMPASQSSAKENDSNKITSIAQESESGGGDAGPKDTGVLNSIWALFHVKPSRNRARA